MSITVMLTCSINDLQPTTSHAQRSRATVTAQLGHLVGLLLLSQYAGEKLKLCGLHYHRGRYALFHLVSVGPLTVELLRRTPFLVFLPSM